MYSCVKKMQMAKRTFIQCVIPTADLTHTANLPSANFRIIIPACITHIHYTCTSSLIPAFEFLNIFLLFLYFSLFKILFFTLVLISFFICQTGYIQISDCRLLDIFSCLNFIELIETVSVNQRVQLRWEYCFFFF